MLGTILILIPPIVLLGYLANRFLFRGSKCKSKNRLNSKVAVVTGANCGIGYETALDLAKRDATVILACRDLNRANEAAEKIKFETANVNVYVEKLDLASLESIRNFVKNFREKFQRLDILINNAGLLTSSYVETKDGFETQFGVMHLGHFYLTYLLLDFLKSSKPSRVVNLTSEAHRFCKLNWNDIMLKNKYSSFVAYQQAKLANILFTLEFNKRYKEEGVMAVSVHPGFVKTEINRHFTEKFGLRTLLFVVIYPFYVIGSMSSKLGAQTSIHCAVADEIPDDNRIYYRNCKPANCSSEAMNEIESKKLWEFSTKILNLE
ncbi:retinol dehydrogenase 13-like [Brachionus plicatilis]|uniref:Retinol dehydrogenase 13-like n=1 Tax=Brachionus plicatilis TaxID=10195 RepID=A0A3M7R396_BRAPC|nr:retinol dehydrogenase 13-like [Brachionus plicatilis]